MVHYGEAFKLPFVEWRKSLLLLLLINLVFVGPLAAFAIVLLKSGATPYSAYAPSSISGLGAAAFFVWLVIAAVFSLLILGYFLRIIGNASHGKNTLPEFKGWLGMFTLSLKYIFALVVYYVVIALAYGVAFLLIALPSVVFDIIGAVLLVALTLAVLIVSVYIFPMLITHFAHENRFAAMFELKKAVKYSFTTAYLVPWLVSFGYSYGVSYVAGIVAYFSIIMVVLAAAAASPAAAVAAIFAGIETYMAALFVIYLTSLNLYGQAYHDVKAASPAAVTSATAKMKGHAKSKK